MLRVTTILGANYGGGPWVSTLYFGGTTSGEANVAVTSTDLLWTGLESVCQNGLDMTVQTDVEVVDPATGQITAIFVTAGGSATGSAGGDALPWSTQGLLRWRTGVYYNGREVRGRMFIPAQTESFNVSGVPSAAWETDVETAAAAFLVAAATAGGHGVYSPTNGVFVPTVAQNAWNEWAILRSRRD